MTLCKGIGATTLNDICNFCSLQKMRFWCLWWLLDILPWGRMRYMHNIIMMILAIKYLKGTCLVFRKKKIQVSLFSGFKRIAYVKDALSTWRQLDLKVVTIYSLVCKIQYRVLVYIYTYICAFVYVCVYI